MACCSLTRRHQAQRHEQQVLCGGARARDGHFYNDWPRVKSLVDGVAGAVHKSFRTVEEARAFMHAHNPKRPRHSNDADADADAEPDGGSAAQSLRHEDSGVVSVTLDSATMGDELANDEYEVEDVIMRDCGGDATQPMDALPPDDQGEDDFALWHDAVHLVDSASDAGAVALTATPPLSATDMEDGADLDDAAPPVATQRCEENDADQGNVLTQLIDADDVDDVPTQPNAEVRCLHACVSVSVLVRVDACFRSR